MVGNRRVRGRSAVEEHLPAAGRTQIDSKRSFSHGEEAAPKGFGCFERYIEVFIVAGWTDFPFPIEVTRVAGDILRMRDEGVVRQRGAFRIAVIVDVRIAPSSPVDVERIQPHTIDNAIELHGLRHLRYVIDMPARPFLFGRVPDGVVQIRCPAHRGFVRDLQMAAIKQCHATRRHNPCRSFIRADGGIRYGHACRERGAWGNQLDVGNRQPRRSFCGEDGRCLLERSGIHFDFRGFRLLIFEGDKGGLLLIMRVIQLRRL